MNDLERLTAIEEIRRLKARRVRCMDERMLKLQRAATKFLTGHTPHGLKPQLERFTRSLKHHSRNDRGLLFTFRTADQSCC